MYIHKGGAVVGAVEAGAVSDPALVVVWADPGVATGWCVVRVSISALVARGQVGVIGEMWWKAGTFRAGSTSASVSSYLALCRAAWERAGEGDIVVLGCEGFRLLMLSTDEALLEPVRFLAVLRDRLLVSGSGVSVEVQYPGERSVITDARLRLWGLWQSGPDHQRDALKHALVFLRRFAGQEMLRKRLGWEG